MKCRYPVSFLLLAACSTTTVPPDRRPPAHGSGPVRGHWRAHSGAPVVSLKASDQAAPGGPALVIQRNFGFAYDLAFNPDAKRLAIATESSLVIWDMTTSREFGRRRLPGVTLYDVEFSPDGRWVAGAAASSVVGEQDLNRLLVWDAVTLALLGELRQQGKVMRLAFSPDGRHIALGSEQGRVAVWDHQRGELAALESHSKSITSLLFATDGSWLASGGRDDALRIWDLAAQKLRFALPGHGGGVNSVVHSSGPDEIMVSDWDGHLIFWNVVTGAALNKVKRSEQFYVDLAGIPDGRLVALETLGVDLLVFDVANDKTLFHLPIDTNAMAFSPDGTLFAVDGQDSGIRVWDVASQTELARIGGLTTRTSKIAINPRLPMLASARGRWIQLWDLAGGRITRVLEIPPPRAPDRWNWVSQLLFSHDGKRLVAHAYDRKIRTWDVGSGELLGEFEQNMSACALALAPNGSLLATAANRVDVEGLPEDQHYPVVLRDPLTGEKKKDLFGHPFVVVSLDFSPDGRYLAAGGRDELALVFDVDSGELRHRLAANKAHSRPKYADVVVDYHPSGRYLATGCAGQVRIWDAVTGTRLAELAADPAVAFSHDGRYLATHHEGRLQLWDVPTWKLASSFVASEAGASLLWSPTDHMLLTSSADGLMLAFDPAKGEQVATLAAVRGGEHIIFSPDRFYTASRAALKTVAFRMGNQVYPFEQFDLAFNRPDVIIERLGFAPADLVEAYRKVRQKRLRKLRVSEADFGRELHLPTVEMDRDTLKATTEQRTITIPVTARDDRYQLGRLHLYVNGVPMHGPRGLPFEPADGHWTGTVEVTLSRGRNRIEVSVMNVKGAESLTQSAEVTYTGPAALPDRYVVAVGVSDYRKAEYDLGYAAKDARDLAGFFAGAHSASRRTHVLTILNRKARKQTILGASRFLAAADEDDEIIVFFAGHGVLDADLNYYFGTTDFDVNRPAARGLAYDDLIGLVENTRARKRLVLMDTCHSGEVDEGDVTATRATANSQVRVRGLKVKAAHKPRVGLDNSFRLMHELFTDLRRETGAQIISSAGGMELALESPRWNNGVFTHALLDGLKSGDGDLDGDGRIMTSELRRFVQRRVEALTGGAQRPTSRRESLEFDFPVQ